MWALSWQWTTRKATTRRCDLVVVSELRGVELPGRPPGDLRVDYPLVTVVVQSVQPVRGPSAAPFRACVEQPRTRVLSLGVLGIAAEVNRHAGLVAHDPCIVTRLDRGNIAGADLALLSTARLYPHAARQAIQQMRRLAAVGPCNRLDVLRPPPAGLERPVQDRVSCHGHHRCAALAREGPRLVGLGDVLDLKVSHRESPLTSVAWSAEPVRFLRRGQCG
jgi:hypothetical protein